MLHNGPADSDTTLILAHGAGAGMDSPVMEAFAAGLASNGVRVIRFEFPYMQQRRRTGKFRGPDRLPGRIASMLADDVGAHGLICLGYPFHPVGKPENLRTAHLAELKIPTLIVQGTRDPFGRPDEVSTYQLSPAIKILWLEDGDHSFKPTKASGRTLEQNIAEAIVAIREFIL